MRNAPKSVPPTPAPPTVPRQLGIAFDSIQLRGMNPSDRAKALAHLASLLMQAAGVMAEERNNDKC
jgi:hypothetical protein